MWLSVLVVWSVTNYSDELLAPYSGLKEAALALSLLCDQFVVLIGFSMTRLFFPFCE